MTEPAPPESLSSGLILLLMGVGFALTVLPGRWKWAGLGPFALVLVVIGATMEGVDPPAPSPDFVRTCFFIWLVLFTIPFVEAVRRWAAGEDDVGQEQPPDPMNGV